MMTPKSVSFITGYLFNIVEKNLIKHINANDIPNNSVWVSSASIPKIWFGLTGSSSVSNDIDDITKSELMLNLERVMNEVFTKWVAEVVYIVPKKQYIEFGFTVKKKEIIKKMTIAEIEKELGYKIEITG